jgi:hypothetical protein
MESKRKVIDVGDLAQFYAKRRAMLERIRKNPLNKDMDQFLHGAVQELAFMESSLAQTSPVGLLNRLVKEVDSE